MEFITGNKKDNARSDIAVNGFNKAFVTTYIDVSIISPTCKTNKKNSVKASIAQAERTA